MKLNPFYRMNNGIVYVFENIDNISKASGIFNYEELSIGSDDYEIAKGEHAQLTARIRVHRQPRITSLNIVKMNGVFYEIWRVRHTVNRHGVPVTDITLGATAEVV